MLKIWNRESRPDVSIQYQVLEQLVRQGCAVSRPYAWGLDAKDHQVLLTSFDGMPVKKVNAASLTAIAANLLDVHKLEINSSSGLKVPAYDFADYFFPAWAEQPEIRTLAQELAERGKLTAHQLIHGDYHLGNILEASGTFTIIDWTNVQLGDQGMISRGLFCSLECIWRSGMQASTGQPLPPKAVIARQSWSCSRHWLPCAGFNCTGLRVSRFSGTR